MVLSRFILVEAFCVDLRLAAVNRTNGIWVLQAPTAAQPAKVKSVDLTIRKSTHILLKLVESMTAGGINHTSSASSLRI